MTDRKYISYEDAAAREWFSRTHWKRHGIAIPMNAEPKDRVWKPVDRTSYPVFAAD